MDKERNRSARPSLEVRLARLYRRGLFSIISSIFFANFLIVIPFIFTFIREIHLFGTNNALAGMNGHILFVLQSSKLIVLWFSTMLIYLLFALLVPRYLATQMLSYIDTLPLAYLLFDKIIIPQSGVMVEDKRYADILFFYGCGKGNTFETRVTLISMFMGHLTWFWYRTKGVPGKIHFIDYLSAFAVNYFTIPLILLFPIISYILYNMDQQSTIYPPGLSIALAILIGLAANNFALMAFNFNMFVSACCKHMTGKWPWEIKT